MFYPIKLDKTRNLKYGMRALSLIEETLGKPVANIDVGDITMKDMATIIWAGLAHEDKSLTPEKVMDLIDDNSSISEAAEVMAKALENSFTDGSKENPKKAAGNKGKSLA